MALCSKNIQTEINQVVSFVYFSLVLREREETKTKYSASKMSVDSLQFESILMRESYVVLIL